MEILPMGGVGEIGGNKFYVKTRDSGLLIDFGISYSKRARFFGGMIVPKRVNYLAALLASGVVPRVSNLYEPELLDPMGVSKELLSGADALEPSAILLSHPHRDHYGHIPLLRRDIPLYMGEGAYRIIKEREETRQGSSIEDSILRGERRVLTFHSYEKLRIGDVEIVPIHVDHSVPSSYGFIIHSPEGSIAYSGDLRLHGPKRDFTLEFADRIAEEGVETMLLEGTRIGDEAVMGEEEVKKELAGIARRAGDGVAAVMMGITDYDRFSSLVEAAEAAGRQIAVSTKLARMIEAFIDMGVCTEDYRPGSRLVKVYLERKRGGVLDVEEEYRGWEKKYVESLMERGEALITGAELMAQQGRYFFVINAPDDVLELLAIRPRPGSVFIFSTSEPHSEEQEIDRGRIENWLSVLGMPSLQVHSSGHASRLELMEVIERARPRRLVPIHTENPHLFEGIVKGRLEETRIVVPRPNEWLSL